MLVIDINKPLYTQAMYLGQRLMLKSLEKTKPLSHSPLTVTAGSNGIAVLFRYGVVVFFGLNAPVSDQQNSLQYWNCYRKSVAESGL